MMARRKSAKPLEHVVKQLELALELIAETRTKLGQMQREMVHTKGMVMGTLAQVESVLKKRGGRDD